MRKLFRKKDLLILVPLVLCAAAILLFQQKGGGCIAVIEENGTEIRRVDLTRQTGPETIDLGGEFHVVLLAEPGAISFQSSGCPDQVCVRTGKLTKPGQAAVCLPAKISVRTVSAQPSQDPEYDGYTG